MTFLPVILLLSIALLVWYLVYHGLAFYLKYSLQGKIILITGCDTGFGNQLAKKLDLMGSTVFASCFNQTTADTLNKETSDNVHVLIMDVTKMEHIKKTYKTVKKYCVDHKSPLFGLVNNAGIATHSPFECISRKVYTNVLNVNCIGLIDITRTFLPLIRMKKYNPYITGKFCKKFGGFYQRGKAGRVVNIASVAGRCPAPYMSPYSVSKYAVVGFTECLRYELDQLFNIWCCTVEPFFTMTNMVKNGMDLEQVRELWGEVMEPNMDETDDLSTAYDLERYLEWKRKYNKVIKNVSFKDCDHVIDSIICALSSVYPLRVYYPSWRAATITRFIKYILPGFLFERATAKRMFTIKPIKDSYLR